MISNKMNAIRLTLFIAIVVVVVTVVSFLRGYIISGINNKPEETMAYLIFLAVIIVYGFAYNGCMRRLNVIHSIPNNPMANIVPISIAFQINRYYEPFTGKKLLGIIQIFTSIISTLVNFAILGYLHFKVGYYYMQGVHIIAFGIILTTFCIDCFFKHLTLIKVLSYEGFEEYYSFRMTRLYICCCAAPLLASLYSTIGVILYQVFQYEVISQYLAFIIYVLALISPMTMSHYTKKCMEQYKYKQLLENPNSDPVESYMDKVEYRGF